jgi:hypothetical protein
MPIMVSILASFHKSKFPPNIAAPAAADFAMHLHDIHDRLVENVKAAQNAQARYYDAKHQKVEFEPDDMI